MSSSRRSRPGPPARVDRKRHWRGSSPLKSSVRIFVYGGGLLLLGVLAWAVPAVLVRHSFSPDSRCQQRALSCGILASFLIPVLSLALVSAFFLLGRLWYLRRQYLRAARDKPADMVPTAGSVIGDVVGRDELCRVMIADVRDPISRRPHVVIGGIGTGKTALLVRLTKLLAHQHAVPVAVRLRDARERLDFGDLARERFIADLQTGILSDTEGEKVWRQLLKEGRIVVLADGLEEALVEGDAEAERDNLIRLAIRQANLNKLPLIIASRPHDPLRGTDAALVELEPLSEEAALDYIQRGDPADDEPRVDWIVETAEVAEAPLYLQVARQLHRAGLLTYPAAPRDDQQLDIRNVDRSGLRLRLLEAWKEALVSGYFPPGVALNRNDRIATIEQLSVLACMGLRQDRLQVGLDFDTPGQQPSQTLGQDPSQPGSPLPVVREVCERLAKAGHRSLDIKLAATWGTQLQLVEAQKNAVRFPHSILQAYLGSRLIGYAMEDDGFRAEALKNAGRELLIALVLYSRATMKQAGREGWADTVIKSGDPAAKPTDLRTLLLKAAGQRSDAKALNLYATALEIDSVATVPRHQDIADEIAKHWQLAVERYPRTLEHAKLNLVRRFGEAARTISERHSQPDAPLKPAHRQLFDIACAESSYPVRLAVAQEIGAGGDDALDQLKGLLRPGSATGRRAQAAAHGLAHAFAGHQGNAEGDGTGTGPGHEDDRETAQREIMRAWLVPLLVGSATSDETRATARSLLQCWLDSIHAQHRQTSRERFGLSLEIALAQGFKYAANRRRGHPHAPEEARAYLAEQTQEMLHECDFWFTRLTLLHALTLWHLPDGGDQRSGRAGNPDYKTLVAHWCGLADHRRRDRFKEHPFVAQAMRLCVRALETGQPERYLWIDESGVVSRVGSCPTRPGRRRKHNLWIPPSTGWTALNARSQQLVADVLLLLNLAERGEVSIRDRDQRLQRTNRNYLPPCIAEDRSPLKPNRPVGTAGDSAPGSTCTAECQFGLCPYPLKGAQPHRQELSEAFCRRQQRLLAPGTPRSRSAPWQEMSERRLRGFWRELGEPVPRAEPERDVVGQGRRRDRRR
jgi:NACHT domain